MNINEEMKLHKWVHNMTGQQSSSSPQAQWCKIKRIPAATFQYRCRKARMIMKKLQENNPGNEAIVSAERIVKPMNGSESELFFAKVNLLQEHHTASGIT